MGIETLICWYVRKPRLRHEIPSLSLRIFSEDFLGSETLFQDLSRDRGDDASRGEPEGNLREGARRTGRRQEVSSETDLLDWTKSDVIFG